jgi:hypothetical protein
LSTSILADFPTQRYTGYLDSSVLARMHMHVANRSLLSKKKASKMQFLRERQRCHLLVYCYIWEELVVRSPKYEKIHVNVFFLSLCRKSTKRWLLAPVYVLCHHVQDSGDQREINAKKCYFHEMKNSKKSTREVGYTCPQSWIILKRHRRYWDHQGNQQLAWHVTTDGENRQK